MSLWEKFESACGVHGYGWDVQLAAEVDASGGPALGPASLRSCGADCEYVYLLYKGLLLTDGHWGEARLRGDIDAGDRCRPAHGVHVAVDEELDDARGGKLEVLKTSRRKSGTVEPRSMARLLTESRSRDLMCAKTLRTGARRPS